ncbi:MAG TPA: 4'-phosphopantetheinyl transferase superfamily protein [Candidatus Thalassarchaeaceae archaeon]|nr:4'-phosphopantetheinyl transferase superfamily protein [Candidatus Thalassarchaeaceae archaeon]
MVNWQPAGPVSPLPLPEECGFNDVIAVWVPVDLDNPSKSLPDLSNVPLVDPVEASTFATPKRALEHASARYALATLLRDNGFNPSDLHVVRDEHRKPNLKWRDHEARERAGGPLSPALPEITLGHSNGISIAAISLNGSFIGLDAEPLDLPRARNLLTMMTSGDELQYLEQSWETDARVGMQEATRTWVVKEAVQKACGLGMNVPPQTFTVLNCEEVVLSHDGHEYRLEAYHWRELLDGRTFVIGFSRLIEIV